MLKDYDINKAPMAECLAHSGSNSKIFDQKNLR